MRVYVRLHIFRFRGQTRDRGERSVLGAALLTRDAATAVRSEIEIRGRGAYTRLSGVSAQRKCEQRPFAAGHDGHRGSCRHIQPRFRRERRAQNRQPVATATRPCH